MTRGPRRVVLLGPQREPSDAGGVVADLGEAGPVALVTAGWQEWEDDDAHLRTVLGADAVNLRLYHRAEEVWREDEELAGAHRKLQQDVRLLRRAYNVRLAKAMEAWMELEGMSGDPGVLGPERDAARSSVQALDADHAARLGVLRERYYRTLDPLLRGSVGRQVRQIGELLDRVGVVYVAGGHVPALLNRLRLFGLDRLLEGKTLVASSGGAMVLTERVVLFHDRPPWGPGHAEVGEVGLGLVPGVVALPDASRRLRLDDPGRVSRMARRFDPSPCVLLDAGTRVEWDGRWHARGARRLSSEGIPEAWSPAA